jgi:dTMP kinase
LLAGLARWLGEHGVDCVVTREPGGTPLGNRLRALFVEPDLEFRPMTEAFVVNASRAQHVEDVIEPALAAGRFVLCDRFADATLAYQGYGRGVDLDALRHLAGIATRGREPDLTLLVDVPVSISRERVRSRALALAEPIDRLEREGAEFHERVRSGYLAIAREKERIVILDGTVGARELLERAVAVLRERGV